MSQGMGITLNSFPIGSARMLPPCLQAQMCCPCQLPHGSLETGTGETDGHAHRDSTTQLPSKRWLARQRKRVQNRELLHYARLLRVEKPMSPYLQAIE